MAAAEGNASGELLKNVDLAEPVPDELMKKIRHRHAKKHVGRQKKSKKGEVLKVAMTAGGTQMWPSVKVPAESKPSPPPPMQPLIRFGTLEKVLLIIAAATFISFSYFGWWGRAFENPETASLPYYVLRTLARMLAAYALVIAFSVPYGIIAGLYRRPRQIMLPLLDIMQSVPVLGYLPAAVFLFTSALPNFQGFELGYEVAAIFLIFTGMAWSVAFSVMSAVRNIPNDLREASNAFGIRGWLYLRRLVLPCIVPSFITGSILAWGGGWYFLVAAELITYGATPHSLPGIGAYLGNAIFKYNNVPSSLLGLVILISVIFTINRTVWRPLSAYAKKFRLQTMDTQIFTETSEPAFIVKLLEKAGFIWDSIDAALKRASRLSASAMRSLHLQIRYVPKRRRHLPLPWYKSGIIYVLMFGAVMLLTAHFFSAALVQPLSDLMHSMSSHPEIINLPYFALRSMLRIGIAYAIALCWTLAAAILITRSRFLSKIFFPLFDIGQSTPALALFPFMVLVVIRFFGSGELSVEIASILLLLTGTQWYLLFNIIGAIRQIPGDVLEASRAFGLRNWKFYRSVLLPAIFPGIVVGSIQAWGGAWNASIVSEYLMFEGHVYSIPGLGSFLTSTVNSPNPDPWIITLTVGMMTLAILIMNGLIWRPLFAIAEHYKFEG